MKRRRFLRFVLGVGTAVAASITWVAERASPVRCVEAVRAKFYPGPRRPLDEAKIAKPGRWEG